MDVGPRRIRSEKLRENQYREGYARALEGTRVEGDRDNVEHMWEQVKRAMVERGKRSMWLSEKRGRGGGITQRVCGGSMR